jgi:glycosyltransferase involved in cell wall biosynthesis
MRILCIISSLGPGGAERVMTWLASGLAGRGHEVTLACLCSPRESAYGRPEAVAIRYLGVLAASSDALAGLVATGRRVRRLRRLYAELRPDVVLSFMDQTNVLALAAALGTPWPVVVCEHTDPARAWIGRGWALGRRLLYPRAATVVVLAEGMRRAFGRRIRSLVEVIPNPVLLQPAEAEAPMAGRKRLLAVGRLHPVKGFDRLVQAFAAVAPRLPEWELVILGEGPERPRLEAQAARTGLGDRIRLPGHRGNPFPLYRGAQALALASSVEGFPNVLVEAMACGLPVLATACTPAIADILEGGRLGLMVAPDSADALAAGLDRLLGDAACRERLAASAPEVLERFEQGALLDRWEALLARRGRP